jgi:RNA polymerase sigma factor (sigma-70 family)
MSSPGTEGNDAAEACRDLLAAARREASEAWGPFELTMDRFTAGAVERVTRRVTRAGERPAPDVLRAWMGRTALADLALAIACSKDAPGAWERLVERLTPRLRGLARSRGVSDADAGTIAADALSETAVRGTGPGARRLIETYEGAGSLFGWAAVILLRRLHRDRARASAGTASLDDGRGDAVADRRDPFAVLAGDDARARFGSALAGAWGELSGRDRLALAWRYLDGLPQTRIAAMLRVSEPHTSRILASAVERLRSSVRAALGSDPGDVGPAWVEVLRRHLVTASGPPPLPVEPPAPRGRGRP